MEQRSAAAAATKMALLERDIQDLSERRDGVLARLNSNEEGAYEGLLMIQEELLGACCAVLELVCVSEPEAATAFSVLLPALQAA
jgi:chromosome segregation ATPase